MKIKRQWKQLFMLGLILLLTYILGTVLTLCWSDWHRSQFYDWPRDLEYTSLFWIELCMAVPLAQLWILCVSRCVRLFRKKPRREIALKNRKAWFAGLSVLLAALTVLNIVNSRAYIPLYAAQEPWAKGYANIYYFFVIVTEVILGAWIWLALKWADGKALGWTGKENRK